MRLRSPLRILDAQARRLARLNKAQWANLSNTGREFYRQRAQLRITGRERLARTDRSYRRSA